jgi:hypothetical protein
MDRQRMEYCLGQVAAYRASGQKSEAWALANGVKPRELASWCSHAQRWRAMLDGVAVAPARRKAATTGFVAARLPLPSVGGTVCIELHAGASRMELHWPLSSMAELALLLREVGR